MTAGEDDALFAALEVPTAVRVRGGLTPASVDPVARVLVDAPVRHLARVFDYAVPETLADTAQPGVRVRVKFAGRLTSGFIVQRTEQTDHVGELAPLERVSSPLPVLTPALLDLCEAVALRYAGIVGDVLRLAIPTRHASSEAAVLRQAEGVDDDALSAAATTVGDLADARSAHSPGAEASYLSALSDWVQATGQNGASDADSEQEPSDEPSDAAPSAHSASTNDSARAHAPHGPRAAYAQLPGDAPGESWIRFGLRAAARVLAAGRSVVWLVPDARELAALEGQLGELGAHAVRLSADQGQAVRWSAWVKALTGRAALIIGTRAAAFAPTQNTGLFLCVDDADDAYLELRSPYPHAREVLCERARREGAALVFVSASRSLEVQRLVDNGWLGDIAVPREVRRSEAPVVLEPNPARDIADLTRIPSRAFALMREALGKGRGSAQVAQGPVLVQVSRVGSIPILACARCRELARCPRCSTRLHAASLAGPFDCPSCHWHAASFHCANCGADHVRSVLTGVDGVHRELGRAFPGVRVIRSGGDHILDAVGDEPQIVVATTGAEPVAKGGYAAGILLDTLQAGRGLAATQRAIFRRLHAASLVRAARLGGRVLLMDDDPFVRRTVVRFEPVEWAVQTLRERAAVHLPPTVRTAEVFGDRGSVERLALAAREAPGLEQSELELLEERTAQADTDPQLTMVFRFSYSIGPQVTRWLAAALTKASLEGDTHVSVCIDDPEAL